MNRNVGNLDRFVRLVIVAVIAWLWYNGHVSGILAVVLGVVAVVLFLTAVLGWCGLYAVFHCSTRRAPPASV